MTKLSRLLPLTAPAILAVSVACEDKPKETKPLDADAGATQSAVDPNLAKAVAAAGKKAAADPGAGSADGPPQNGVFAPGKADEQLARGAPPKIALGEAGAEPRAVLTSTVAPGFKQSGKMEVTLRLGRAQLPGLSVALGIEAQKPKEPAAGGTEPAPAADGTALTAKIVDLKVPDGLGPQGKELSAQLSKMKGSKIGFRLATGGVGVDFSYELAKGAAADLDMVLRAVGDALESTAVGFPKEAVGPGGYWLVTTRGTISGGEVLTYRMVKLEKVEGDRLTFNVSTKRYSTSQKLELPGLPPGAELEQFQYAADSKLDWTRGAPLASSGTSKQSFSVGFLPAGGGDQRLGLQSTADVTLELGGK
jgi:hypothetical protein